jgi:hypothetical protein
MHPFLPILSLVLLLMGDWGAFYLWRYGMAPEVAPHRQAIMAVVFIALLFGGALALWLRRYRVRYPSYFLFASAIFLAGLWLVRLL